LNKIKKISFNLFVIKLAFAGLFLLCFKGKGNAQINEPAPVTDLIERWKNYNLENTELHGWRIQLLATVDRRQVESVQRTFENRYPDYPTHVVNNQPYFHLKTGAFLTAQKAQAFLKKLQRDYPAAIIVADMLTSEELLIYDQ
jgi:hypothetical protein